MPQNMLMKQSRPDLISIRDSKTGKGLFATEHIPKSTVLLTITGRPVTFRESAAMGESQSYCLQVGDEEYIIPDMPFRMSNHSCEPNCGINNNLEFFSLTDIKKDEELLWDYSTSMLERYWTMECHCGSSVCRKIITDFDLIPPALQLRYISLEIVMPFILPHLLVLSHKH